MKVLRIHGRLAQRDIAKYNLKSSGNITILIDNLETIGLVTRDRDTVDRRRSYVQLTAEGERVFDSIYPAHIDRIKEAMSGLTDQECELLISLLQKVSPDEVDVACAPSVPISNAR